MREKINGIIKSSFIRSVLIMVSGTVGAQLIKMILSPLLTRIYDPSVIGVMGTFLSITQIIIPIAAFTYPMAIVLPKNDLYAKGLMRLSMYISLITSILILSVLVLFHDKIVNLFNISELSGFLYFLPIVIILTAYMQIYEQWFIRKKKFRINATSMFYQALIVEGSKVGLGFFTPTAIVLVTLTAINNGVRGAFLQFFGRKEIAKTGKKEKNIKLLAIAKKFKDFPLLRMPQMFIDATTQSLPILMLASFFSSATAGFFTICNTVLALPSSLIGNAIGNVFYPRINEAALNRESLTRILKKATLSLSGVGIFPFAIIIVFGPWLFEFIFGDGWSVAGEYARWLAFSRFFRFVNEPCIRALPVLSAQSLHLSITIIQTITRIIALSLGFIIFNNDIIAIALYGLSGAVINVAIIFITFAISKKFDANS